MSNLVLKKIKLEQIAAKLTEGVDLENVQPLPLSLNQRTTFQYNGTTYGMMIEPHDNNSRDWLPKTVPSDEVLVGYYNFGFDYEGFTQRQVKQSYKDLAQPLAVIVKSLIEWIRRNQPEMVTLYADGATPEERKKKLNLYVSLLNRESSLLNGLGYTWDYANTKVTDQGVVIWKIKK
jgi:hypothetical protein